MHQLRRVEAGLEGKVMEIELADLERMRSRSATPGRERERGLPEGDDSRLDALIAKTGAGSGGPAGGDAEVLGLGAEEEVEGRNYQEQLGDAGVRDQHGEIGDRSNVVGNVKHVPQVQATNGKKRPHEEDGQGGHIDKAARKKAKKMRAREEKVRRESERMAGKELEVLDEQKSNGHANGSEQQDVDMTIEDTGDNRDQTEYQGDEVPERSRGKPWPDTPDVYRADVPNSTLNGEQKDGDVVRSGVDGKPQKTNRKKKERRKSKNAGEDEAGKPLVGSGADGDVPAPENDEERLSKEDKMDIDTELARDTAQKVSKVERMVGRTPVKDNGVAGKVEPASSPVPGTKEDEEVQDKKKRKNKNEKKRDKKRKSEVVDVD